LRDKLILFAKGIPVGISNVVPGISGGTIALILQIYDPLIDSIKALKWKYLLPLAGGIAAGVLSTVGLFNCLMDVYPNFIEAVLFGLIIASAVCTRKEIKVFNIWGFLSITAGITLAYFIVSMSGSNITEVRDMNLYTVAASGFVSAMSMLLPGISGATILVLMGMYRGILDAVAVINIPVIVVFLMSAIAGIFSLSWILSYILDNYRDTLMGFLTGLILGSAYAVLPAEFGLIEILAVMMGIIIVIILSKMGSV